MAEERNLEVAFNGDDAPQDIFDNDDLTIGEMDARYESVAKNIGYVIIHFNALDDLVSMVVSDLTFERLGTQDFRSAIFLSEMTFNQRVTTLMKLYGLRAQFESLDNYSDRTKSIGLRLIESAKRRNQYAHADWLGTESMTWVKTRTKISRKRDRISHQYRSFNADEMKEDLAYIKQTLSELDDLHSDVFC